MWSSVRQLLPHPVLRKNGTARSEEEGGGEDFSLPRTHTLELYSLLSLSLSLSLSLCAPFPIPPRAQGEWGGGYNRQDVTGNGIPLLSLLLKTDDNNRNAPNVPHNVSGEGWVGGRETSGLILGGMEWS